MKRNRSKRRRDKYNPLPTHAGKRFSEPFHRNQIYEKDNRCYISFKDGQGDSHEMEISRELFNEFDLFELEDISYLNKWDRHIEHSEIWDGSLNERAIYHTENIEDTVLKQEQFYEVRQAIRNPRSKSYHQEHFKELLKKCGLPDIHFHQLRNTYTTLLLKNDFQIKSISTLLGHAQRKCSPDIFSKDDGQRNHISRCVRGYAGNY